MAKRRRSADDDDVRYHRRTEKRSRRRRRLHLLTHDWDRGFSMYKLDVGDFEPDDSGCEDMDSRAHRLPRRPVIRLAGSMSQKFVAVGTKIFNFYRANKHRANIVFDTNTLGVTATPPFQSPKDVPNFWSVGHTVYVLDCFNNSQNPDGRFEKLPGPEPRPGRGVWRWEALPSPPFNVASIESHAVHPDGTTVFLSVYREGTFSFDGERHAWARHGRWPLLFLRKAYFVPELDAWVGLSSQRWGHIAACRVVSRRDDPGGAEPACNTGGELLYRRDWKRHLDYNLTYMGNAEFCIQETLTRKGDDFISTFSQRMLMLLRLLTFRVEYSADGELCAVNRREKIFKLTRKTAAHPPSAFWI